MTTSADILVDGFERVRSASQGAGRGLTRATLEAKIDPETNTIAWLLWHIGRGQDAQVSSLMGEEQVWTADGWSSRFGLDLADDSTGYAHTPDDVSKVSGPDGDLYLGYINAVCDRSINYVGELGDADFDDIVDGRFTPPVTRAVRLFSVISDDLQHAGQAAILRGIFERRG
jgi:DinB superfamily